MLTLIVEFGKNYAHTHCAVKAAEKVGCGSVIVLTDKPRDNMDCEDVEVYRPRAQAFYDGVMARFKPAHTFGLYCLLRYFFAAEYCRINGIKDEPVFTLDWDVLMFSNPDWLLEPFSDWDFTYTTNDHGMGSAAQFVRHPGVIESFCQWLELNLKSQTLLNEMYIEDGDMALWHIFAQRAGLKKVNIGVETERGFYDHNLGVSGGFRVDDTGYKLVRWVDQVPHFERPDGRLVRAHNLHCWNRYKDLVPVMARLGGVID